MHSVGVDIVEIGRIRKALARFGNRFLYRVYTEKEVVFCRGRVQELACRFAAKEAVSKALGTGLRGISWREIEILPDRRGKPLVFLHGKALARAQEIGLKEFAVSLSHEREMGVAFVVGSSE